MKHKFLLLECGLQMHSDFLSQSAIKRRKISSQQRKLQTASPGDGQQWTVRCVLHPWYDILRVTLLLWFSLVSVQWWGKSDNCSWGTFCKISDHNFSKLSPIIKTKESLRNYHSPEAPKHTQQSSVFPLGDIPSIKGILSEMWTKYGVTGIIILCKCKMLVSECSV